MISGDPEHLGQGCIYSAFKSTGAEIWKLALGHTLLLQFLCHNLAEINTIALLK